MKTCSKCKRELPETEFVKSPRYLDGLYPHCKNCRKANQLRYLSTHAVCAKCKIHPHLPKHAYCYECNRIACGNDGKLRRRVAKVKGMCPVCNDRPKHRGKCCRPCATARNKAWVKSRGGQWAYGIKRGVRYKLLARAYLNHMVAYGKIEKKPCEVCGKLEVQAHHDSYWLPLEVRWLCKEHHEALHCWLRIKAKEIF